MTDKDRNLIKRVARGLGWTYIPELVMWRDREGRSRYNPGASWLTSLDACQRDFIPDIERRGKRDRFIGLLIDQVPEAGIFRSGWGVARASPRQWCGAYLAIVESAHA